MATKEGDEHSDESRLSKNGVHSTNNRKIASTKSKTEVLLKQYYSQVLEGCGNAGCDNEFCSSSGKIKVASPNEAAVMAFKLLQKKAKLCAQSQKEVHSGKTTSEINSEMMDTDEKATQKENSNSSALCSSEASLAQNDPAMPTFEPLTASSVMKAVEEFAGKEDWVGYKRWLGSSVFPNTDVVKESFLRDLSNEAEPMDHYGVTICLDEVKSAFDALFAEKVASETLSGLPPLLTNLMQNAEIEINYRNAVTKEPHYLNVLALVAEIPIWNELEFVHGVHGPFAAFAKALSVLKTQAKAKLVEFWSKRGSDWLLERVQAVHQAITIQIVENTYGRKHVQDDLLVTNSVKVLYLFYCAAMLGGEKETQSELKREQEFYAPEEDEMKKLAEASGTSENTAKQERRAQMLARELLGEGQMSAEDSDEHENETGMDIESSSSSLTANNRRRWGMKGRRRNGQDEAEMLLKELSLNLSAVIRPLVLLEEFYNESLCDVVEMDKDFINMKMENRDKAGAFSFLNYPWVLTPAVKIEGMYFDNRIRMMSERRTAVFNAMSTGFYDEPYLQLHVRRDAVVHDSLVFLELVAKESPADLKKQLKVIFQGEPGVDEGGVSKEFYQIITQQLFNPDFGMFVYNPETRLYWFNPSNTDCDAEFTLIGILFGLAIYNSIIVDVQFPLVLYRKLRGKLGQFVDLEQLDPLLYRSLKNLLDYEEEDVEETFCFSFQISFKDVYGGEVTEDLKVGGATIPVNSQNKKEFVDLYTDFLLNRAVRKQFGAFRRGFRMVTDESPLYRLFRPEEIEQLVCGTKHFDFDELEASTVYDNGYDENHPTIKHFWKVVHSLSEEEKKLLLQFTTGSDRVPVGGLAKLRLIVAKNGADGDKLPTAHTCFNVLLLPEYSTEEKMRDRLLVAITNCRGFGLQ